MRSTTSRPTPRRSTVWPPGRGAGALSTTVGSKSYLRSRRHPWLAPAMSLTRPQLAPNALAHTEWMLGALDDTALGLNDRMYINVMVFSYVRGVATAFEPEAEAARETGLSSGEWMDTQQENLESLIAAGAMPTLRRLLRSEDFDLDLDRLFEFGLTCLLDGLERFVGIRA